ncbi:MAG: peptidyl-prolyl cis-trans isomerase [Gammaproteobacteria bacterium]|nr:peptidyl-prolyl cis-trans isomerase [Gammaproteobacteria bacterium]
MALSFTLLLPTTSANPVDSDHPRVAIETNLGKIVLELNKNKAPVSVENFLRYVNEGFYDNTIFHRVINNFMIQGGGFTKSLQKKEVHDSIKNEADNGLKNDKGSIAMARTSNPHSATGQFFINVVNNDFLNHSAPTSQGWGYAVFGKVVEGMDVIDKIREQATGAQGPFPSDVPKQAVIMTTVTVIK